MALITPEFLQTQKYSAMRDRLAFQHGGPIQPGAWDAGDFKVVQRAAGAAQAIDVGAGFAVVGASAGGNFGYYHVQNDAAITNIAVTASHATLPRIDSVYLVVNDSTNGGDANDTPAITVVAGTATSGATLDNRTGAPTAPTDALLLADILIPAASTSVVTANIRDRRPWARGAHWRSSLASQSWGSGSLVTVTGSSQRMELSGNGALVMQISGYQDGGSTSAGDRIRMAAQVDGVSLADFYEYVEASTVNAGNAGYWAVDLEATGWSVAGSHLLDWKMVRNGGNNYVLSSLSIRYYEDLRPSATNT